MEKTPARSLSLLLEDLPHALGHQRMSPRRHAAVVVPGHRTLGIVLGLEHPLDGVHQRAARIAQKPGQAAQRLGGFGVKQMEDGPGQQRGPGLDPVVVEPLAVRIDHHVHDVLHVLGFVHRAQPHLLKRVVLDAGAGGVGRIELEADLPQALARARGKLPILALEVVDQGRVWPGQQGRNHHADALAAPRGRHHQHMARAAVAQISIRARFPDRSRPGARAA